MPLYEKIYKYGFGAAVWNPLVYIMIQFANFLGKYP